MTKAAEIIEEDGAAAALAELAEEVHDAEGTIREVLAANPGETWSIKELQDEAAKVSDHAGLSPSVMSIAFLRLEAAGVVSVGSDLQVRAVS